jgi:pseudouridine-5'-phosphate glycosidase
MLIAKKAAIPILSTGGIGGVHRYVEFSMDISADLKELGQTPVAIVCSGVKSLMDIPKTLEYLVRIDTIYIIMIIVIDLFY